MAARVTAVLFLLAASCIALTLPVAVPAVSGLVLAAAVATWRRPVLAFAALAAALPVLDLTPWTGRFYFGEFDALLLASFGAALWAEEPSRNARLSRVDAVLLIGLLLSYVVGMAVGLVANSSQPESLPWGNAYTHPLNAVRVAKPALYAAVVWWLLFRTRLSPERSFASFLAGSLVGLSVTVALVARERLQFCGLVDLSSEFRVTGPFSDMHTGGAYLDAYLVMTIPFLAWAFRRTSRSSVKAALLVLLLGAVYGVCVTLSRSPVVIVALQVLMLFLFWKPVDRLGAILPRLATVGILLMAAGWGISAFTPLASRFETSSDDWNTRVHHWGVSLSAMQGRNLSTMVGAGCGSFPRAYRDAAEAGAAFSDYALSGHGDSRCLSLRGGSGAIYFGQRMAIEPHADYDLVVNARRLSQEGHLHVSLCEKSQLSSYESVGRVLLGGSRQGEWEVVRETVNSANVGERIDRRPLPAISRPVVLSFRVSDGAEVEIDSIELLGDDGKDLLRNGDFASGFDRWWWTSDNHLAWHTHSLYLHLLIEQGVVGLLVFLLLSIRTMWTALQGAVTFHPAAFPLACSLGGFLAMGVIDSLVDSPRIALLYFVLVLFVLRYQDAFRPEQSRQSATGLTPAIR